MSALILKPGREKSLLRRHPWVFAGAVSHLERAAAPGATVEVLSSEGEFLARAAYSPRSQIRARVWTFDDEAVDTRFLRARIRAALDLRRRLNLSQHTDAYRLIHAESDGLPGLIVDRYGDVLVLQSLSAGCELWKENLADLLLEETGVETIYERSDADVRELEGLEAHSGLLRGREARLADCLLSEHGLRFRVDVERGHKTGFYLDQRENRQRVRQLAEGREVLDCFCYSGGFTVHALAGRAKSVLAVDASPQALALAHENLVLNGFPIERTSLVEGDVFHVLRTLRDEGRSFDMIILDPPKFAPTAAQAGKAARGYKDINRLAFKLLRREGILVTFSCSGGVDAVLFQKIVASAALDAGVEAQIIERLSQAADHPVALNFPEGAYLKGLICVRR